MTSWRTLSAVIAGVLVVGLAIGEGVARVALDHRLSRGDQTAVVLEFAGVSALVALATREMPLRAHVALADLADRIADNADGALSGVESADGLIGLHFDDGLGPLPGPTTAWVALTVDDGEVVATIVSVELGEIQFQPGAVLGNDLTFPVPLGEQQCDDGAPVDSVSVTDDAVELSLTVTSESLSCLDLQEEA